MNRADFPNRPRNYAPNAEDPGKLWLNAQEGRHVDEPELRALQELLGLTSYGSLVHVSSTTARWSIDAGRLTPEQRTKLERLLMALVKRDGVCRWPDTQENLDDTETSVLVPRARHHLAMSLDSLVSQGRLNLASLSPIARSMVLLIADQVIGWAAPPMTSQVTSVAADNRALSELAPALEQARVAIARLQGQQRAQVQHTLSAIECWVALERGHLDTARAATNGLREPEEQRPLRIGLAWYAHDTGQMLDVAKAVMAAANSGRVRIDGKHGDALVWDVFLRLAIGDGGAVSEAVAWLAALHAELGEVSLSERELASLKQANLPGNSPAIANASHMLLVWHSRLRARQAWLQDESQEDLEDLPGIEGIEESLLPTPFRIVWETLTAIPAAKQEPVGTASGGSILERDDDLCLRLIERGELEQATILVPDAPQTALIRGKSFYADLGPRWKQGEVQRARCGLFLLACRAHAWDDAIEHVAAVLESLHTLSHAEAWDEGLWHMCEALNWSRPDLGRAVAIGVQAVKSPAYGCLELWNALVGSPGRKAARTLDDLVKLEASALNVNGMRRRLAIWWLGQLEESEVDLEGNLVPLIAAYDLAGLDVAPRGELEAHLIENLAILGVEDLPFVIEKWLGLWTLRLKKQPAQADAAREWSRFADHILNLGSQGLVGEATLWQVFDSFLFEHDQTGATQPIAKCQEMLKDSQLRLESASRMLNAIEQLTDRLETAVEVEDVCRLAVRWLHVRTFPPGARPFCLALLDTLRRLSLATGFILPELSELSRRFSEAASHKSSEFLQASEALRGRVVAIVGGYPATFTHVRSLLRDEDQVADVLHIPAGKGTGGAAESALRADFVLFVTTCVGHDDVDNVESLIRRRRSDARVIRLPDRRDGAQNLVQLLRTASLLHKG